MKKLIVLCLLIAFIPGAGPLAQDDTPANREIKWGKAYPDIGTFGGWSFWIGFDANFSETYAPESETYAWVVHFAPEAVYLSLQKAKSVYSGVDVNAGFTTFYGMVDSPDGDVLTRKFVSAMSAKTFSVTRFGLDMKVGPLSSFSMGIASNYTFFTDGVAGPFVRAVQFGTGRSVSFALVANPFPFSVSLDKESGVEAGFYPIATWDVPADAADPVAAVREGLKSLAGGKGRAFADIHNAYAAAQTLAVLEAFPMNGMVDEFIRSEGEDSEIDELLREVAEWDKTGDTKKLPEKLKPKVPPEKLFKLMNPLQSAAVSAFESGYKRGYDSTKRNDTVYADCLTTIRARAHAKVKIEATREEIVALLPDLADANLEGVKVVFDNPPETYLASQKTETAVTLKNGRAVLEFQTASDAPVLLGVRIDKSPKTKNKTLELCRRLVVFE